MGLIDWYRKLVVIVDYKYITLMTYDMGIPKIEMFKTTFEGWQDFMVRRANIKEIHLISSEEWKARH